MEKGEKEGSPAKESAISSWPDSGLEEADDKEGGRRAPAPDEGRLLPDEFDIADVGQSIGRLSVER